MIVRLPSIALRLLLASPFATALFPSDIPTDTPVSQLIKDASAKLASGNTQDALTYYEVAISRDPQNYLTFFRRGAAYLSLGKAVQAQNDFDKVLELKPGFEGALLQRAKIKARKADWAAAKADYKAAGKAEEIAQLDEAQGAALLAEEAVSKGEWDACVTHAGTAILVAGASYDIRKTRARCRFERGEVVEGIADLQHLLQINTDDIEPYLQSSAMTYYSLGETDKGLKHMARCLQSDPDSKPCIKLRRREKNLDKTYQKVRKHFERRQFATASKLLVDRGEDEPGLLKEVKQDFQEYVAAGYIYAGAPQGLYQAVLEMTCEAYVEMNNHKRGAQYCTETLQLNPDSLFAALHKAQQHLDNDEFEQTIHVIEHAKQHSQNQKLNDLHQKAQMLLKRSKQKDYYKVLGLTRDANEREIKKAYRKHSKLYHPDKAAAQGLNAEEAQKKMAAVNEAYEVLNTPELRERFDRGDDPNSQEQQGSPFHGSSFGGQQFVFRQGGASFQFQGGFPGGFGF